MKSPFSAIDHMRRFLLLVMCGLAFLHHTTAALPIPAVAAAASTATGVLFVKGKVFCQSCGLLGTESLVDARPLPG